jgi:hypothetical protein
MKMYTKQQIELIKQQVRADSAAMLASTMAAPEKGQQ